MTALFPPLRARDLFEIAHVGRDGRIVLLKVYLDESGHSDGPICSMAGFAGFQQQWDGFDVDWLRAIHPRKSLHMAELRWNTKPHRLKTLLTKAGAVPDKHALGRVAATVTRKDYEDFVVGTSAEDIMTPYMMCFQYCLKAVLEGIPTEQRVHVFLEEQRKYEPHVQFLYDQVFTLRKRDARLVGFTFLGKDAALAFQAADYLAFHTAKYKADPTDPKAVLTRPIFGNGHGVGWNMTRAEVEEYATAAIEKRRELDDRDMEAHALHRLNGCGD